MAAPARNSRRRNAPPRVLIEAGALTHDPPRKGRWQFRSSSRPRSVVHAGAGPGRHAVQNHHPWDQVACRAGRRESASRRRRRSSCRSRQARGQARGLSAARPLRPGRPARRCRAAAGGPSQGESRCTRPPRRRGWSRRHPKSRQCRTAQKGDRKAVRPIARFTETGVIWDDGATSPVDAVVWCTGFRPATAHLRPLGIVEPDGRVEAVSQRSVREPGLWLAGYGNWTGAASATLIGAGRTARDLVPRIVTVLDRMPASTHAGVPH